MPRLIEVIFCLFLVLQVTSKRITLSQKRYNDRSEHRKIIKLFDKFQNELSNTRSKGKLNIYQQTRKERRLERHPIWGNRMVSVQRIPASPSSLHRRSLRRNSQDIWTDKQKTVKQFKPQHKHPVKQLMEVGKMNTKEVKAQSQPHLPRTAEENKSKIISIEYSHPPVVVPIPPPPPAATSSFYRTHTPTEKKNLPQPHINLKIEGSRNDIKSKMLKEGRKRLKSHEELWQNKPEIPPQEVVKMIAPGIGINEYMLRFVQLNRTPIQVEQTSEWK